MYIIYINVYCIYKCILYINVYKCIYIYIYVFLVCIHIYIYYINLYNHHIRSINIISKLARLWNTAHVDSRSSQVAAAKAMGDGVGFACGLCFYRGYPCVNMCVVNIK